MGHFLSALLYKNVNFITCEMHCLHGFKQADPPDVSPVRRCKHDMTYYICKQKLECVRMRRCGMTTVSDDDYGH